SGIREEITVANRAETTADVVLEIDIGADFAAMLGIRGAVSQLASPAPIAPSEAAGGVRFARAGHATRVTTVPEGLQHRLRLDPGQNFTIQIDVALEPATPPASFETSLRAARDVYPRWAEDCMSVRTDNPALNQLLEQATADVRMLCDSYETGMYPTAGLPWFAVPFGRDALITSIFLLPVNPELARGVLRYLAKHQGRQPNVDTEEQPGKILHEVRDGEVVERGFWPHILYGTIDATALFLCALTETEDWSACHAGIRPSRRTPPTSSDGSIATSGFPRRSTLRKRSTAPSARCRRSARIQATVCGRGSSTGRKPPTSRGG